MKASMLEIDPNGAAEVVHRGAETEESQVSDVPRCAELDLAQARKLAHKDAAGKCRHRCGHQLGGQLRPDPHAGPVEEAFATLVIRHELRGGRWYLATACLAVEPRAFLALDGFDERFDDASGEDWDLCRRAHGLGIDVTASDRFGVHHRNPTRLRQMLSRSRRYARSARLRFAQDRGVSASAPDARLVRRMQRGGSPVLLALYLAGNAPREIRARYRLVRAGGRSVGRSLLVLLIHLPWLASYTVFSLVHGRTVTRQSLRT